MVLLSLLVLACSKASPQQTSGSGTIPKEERNMDDLSDAVDAILNEATADFIGNYSVTEGFFYWIAGEYSEDVILEIVKTGDVSDPEIWFEKTGSSIHVLWQDYCESTGLDAYDYSHIHKVETADDTVVSLDFSGDVNLCEDAATTIHMDAAENGILDCFSEDLISEMQGADIFVVNNEFAYTTRGEPLEGKAFTFRANPERVNELFKIGCDLVTLANNHVWDYGIEGITDTLDTLNSVNMPYVGAGYNLADASRAQYYIANGRKIAIVDATQIERSYTYTKQATVDTPGVLKTLNSELYCKVIEDAKKHSDVVIACVHWGTEGNTSYGADQIKLANEFVAAGADVIVGGHTHCLQGIEYIEDVPVYYSLGNYWFATSANMPADYNTGLARIEITNDLEIVCKFIPCRFSGGVTSLLGQSDAEEIYDELNELSNSVTISDLGIVIKY